MNPAYERLTGYTMEEVAGKDSRELKSERNKPELQDVINGQLKKGKVRNFVYIQCSTGPQIRVCRDFFFLILNQNICCGYSKEPSH